MKLFASVSKPTVWDQLEKLLYAPNIHVRQNTIYTIGKVTDREWAGLLKDAFPFYFENDPLSIPRLISEILWLTHEVCWPFLEQLASARHYLSRWALCSLLDAQEDREVAQRFLSLLPSLSNDPNQFVAAEANFRSERIKVKLGPRLAKPIWRKEVKRIAQLEPKYVFDTVTNLFLQGREDYKVPEFDAFLAQLPK